MKGVSGGRRGAGKAAKRVEKTDQSLKSEKVEMMVSSPERRKSESPIVLKEERDRGCNRFSSHLPCGDPPVGVGLLANDRGYCGGGGPPRLVTYCKPSSLRPLAPR